MNGNDLESRLCMLRGGPGGRGFRKRVHGGLAIVWVTRTRVALGPYFGRGSGTRPEKESRASICVRPVEEGNANG